MGIFSNDSSPSKNDGSQPLNEMDSLILEQAVDLGFITPDKGMDFLNENYGTEVRKIKMSKEGKFRALIRRVVLSVARAKNDPDYATFRTHRLKAEEARKRLMVKYKSEATARAKEIITNFSKLKNREVPKGTRAT
jgi:hypothetical protein